MRTSRSAYSRPHVVGYRSGLEEKIAADLSKKGVPSTYESHFLEYVVPTRVSKYTPDFILPNGIVIESKGLFETKDRQKHILIKKQHPDLDIRFVFSNPRQRISKKSKTTYAMWCEKHGFQFDKALIPQDWIDEPACRKRLRAVAAILIPKQNVKA